MPLVSVIIPSYRSSATVGRTLNSLFGQTRPEILKEILVVDSSEDEASRRFLDEARREGLRILRLPEKTIPALARNFGPEAVSHLVPVSRPHSEGQIHFGNFGDFHPRIFLFGIHSRDLVTDFLFAPSCEAFQFADECHINRLRRNQRNPCSL